MNESGNDFGKKLQQLELQMKLYGLNKKNKFKQYNKIYKEYIDFRQYINSCIKSNKIESNYYIIDVILENFIYDLSHGNY